jgi:DNA polymerase III sliding clamp (beta) subunit (PCNA family)
MITIEYSIKDLLAIMECASDEEVRYYLRGVHLDIGRDFNTGRMAGRLCATNGQILMTAALDREDFTVTDENAVKRELILDIDSLKKYVKKPKVKGVDKCEITLKSDGTVWYCDLNDVQVTYPINVVDGRFPEVIRVIRSAMDSPQVAETIAPVSALYLKTIAKVAELVNTERLLSVAPIIWPKQSTHNVVQFASRSDMLMVVMGCRTPLDEVNRTMPYWLERDLMDETDHADTGT